MRAWIWAGVACLVMGLSGCSESDSTTSFEETGGDPQTANTGEIGEEGGDASLVADEDAEEPNNDVESTEECTFDSDCEEETSAPCVQWACDQNVCVEVASPQGAACEDGNACTSGETCDASGACVGGEEEAVESGPC